MRAKARGRVAGGRARGVGHPEEDALTYWLGLGANVGDPVANLRRALEELAGFGATVIRVSSAYRTAPRDDLDQPEFINAAAAVEWTATPPQALRAIKAIERRLGRERTRRFGPRSIDIDILMWSGGVVEQPQLQIPHPRLDERRFALVPLAQIAADLTLPDGTPLARRADELAADPDQSVELVAGVVLWPPPVER